jgi:hypothetical protein
MKAKLAPDSVAAHKDWLLGEFSLIDTMGKDTT